MIIQPLALGTFTPYAIILSVSGAVGIVLSWLLAGRDREGHLDGGIVLVLMILIGSRLSFVVRNFPYFQSNPLEIPQFWLGGLSWPGALLGAAAGILLVHLIWKEPLGELIDSYLALYGTLAVGIWLTSWGTRAGYGPPTESWFGIRVTDIFGVVKRRWPLPILGAVLSAGWTAGVIFYPLNRQLRAGFRGLLGLSGLILLNGAASFFRVDPAPLIGGLRTESWISILLILAALAYFYWSRPKDHKDEEHGN